jgi:ankyrin repeat protein
VARHRADVITAEADGTTALHWAVHAGDVPAARALLREAPGPTWANRYGMTPLALAARGGHAALLDLLFEGGATLGAADAALRGGQTTLMLAAGAGGAEAVETLLRHGATADAAEARTGTTALMWAALANRAEAIRALVRGGAAVNARAATHRVSAHAARVSSATRSKTACRTWDRLCCRRVAGPPVMYAARQGAGEAVAALADAGADLNATDPDGATPLALAVINGHSRVAVLLLARGADPNLADRTGMTPLYAAVDLHTMQLGFGRPDPPPATIAGSVEVVKALLAHGADPDARLTARVLKRVYTAGDGKLAKGATPYMRAARAGDVTLDEDSAGRGRRSAPGAGEWQLAAPAVRGPGLPGTDRGHRGHGARRDWVQPRAGRRHRRGKYGGRQRRAHRGHDQLRRVGDGHGLAGDCEVPGRTRRALDIRNKQGRTALESVLRAQGAQPEIAAFLATRSPPRRHAP